MPVIGHPNKIAVLSVHHDTSGDFWNNKRIFILLLPVDVGVCRPPERPDDYPKVDLAGYGYSTDYPHAFFIDSRRATRRMRRHLAAATERVARINRGEISFEDACREHVSDGRVHGGWGGRIGVGKGDAA